MECEFCKKIFSNISSLNYHKKYTKYCLKIQGKENNTIQEEKENCEICNKEFNNKKHLIQHIKNTCYVDLYKVNKMMRELKLKRIELEELCKEKDNNIIKLEAIIDTKDNIYKNDHECLKNIAMNAKVTNNITNNSNKILNLNTKMDFDIDKIKNILSENSNIQYILEGQKGFAKFALDNLLKDENGNLKYICTDPSRNIFKYKDDSGDIKKDIEAKKLTNYLVDGGIKKKAIELSVDLYTDEKGNIDYNRFQEFLEKSNSINIIDKDNTEFRKELINFVSI